MVADWSHLFLIETPDIALIHCSCTLKNNVDNIQDQLVVVVVAAAVVVPSTVHSCRKPLKVSVLI